MTKPGTIASFAAPLDGLSRKLAAAAFVPLLAQWGFVAAFVWPRLGTLRYLRLHYTASRGVDWIDDWRMIFVFPAVGLVVWFVNIVLAARLASASHHLARLVLGITVFVEALVAVGGVLAVLLNV